MIKRYFAVFFVSAGFLTTSPAFCEEPLSLASTIEEALKNNPEILAAKRSHEAALARVRFLRTMEDPRLEYEYNRIAAGADAVISGESMPMHMYSVSQEVPFPTKLLLRKQAAEKEARSLQEEYKEKQNEIIQKVKESYFMLSLINKETQITRETTILLEQLIKTLANRYSIGKASQQEVLKAQTEYAKLDNELILLEQRKKIGRAMLKALLNRPQSSELAEPPAELAVRKESFRPDTIFDAMRENRPELLAAQKMLEKSKIDYRLAMQEYLPDFMMRYTLEEKDGSAGEWAGMLGLTVPLWFWEKQDSFVKEAKAQVGETEAEYRNMENMISYEVEAALAKVEAQQRLVSLYETSFLPQAEAAFKASSVGFEAGKNDFLDYLDSQRMFLEFKLDHARAMVDLEIARADLERAAGVSLETEKYNEKK